ncbi:hypothetical protein GOODEAATRI_018763, partial [Goodea atripinnis]
NLNFLVTTSMVPSIRLLVYYILDGEGTTELVADSVWMDIKDKYSAVFTLRPNYRDPVSTVLRHIENSDLGCGGGGGKDNADIFRLAGLTFMTNANASPSSSTRTYGSMKKCCEEGMKYIPKSVTCHQYANQKFRKHKIVNEKCKTAFRECCEYIQQNLDQNDRLVLGRYGESRMILIMVWAHSVPT